MVIRFLKVNPELPMHEIRLSPPMTAISTMKSSVESYRTAAVWNLITDGRSYAEAVEKLHDIIRNDMEITAVDVRTLVPCLVDLKEAKTMREEEYIRRAQKSMMKTFSGLIDRFVKYRPESRKYAVDWLRQELINTSPIWRPYQCEEFRKLEVVGKGVTKSKKSIKPIQLRLIPSKFRLPEQET